MRRYLFGSMLAVLVVTSIALGQGQAPASAPTKAYRFERIANGVHFATGTGLMTTMTSLSLTMNAELPTTARAPVPTA